MGPRSASSSPAACSSGSAPTSCVARSAPAARPRRPPHRAGARLACARRRRSARHGRIGRRRARGAARAPFAAASVPLSRALRCRLDPRHAGVVDRRVDAAALRRPSLGLERTRAPARHRCDERRSWWCDGAVRSTRLTNAGLNRVVLNLSRWRHHADQRQAADRSRLVDQRRPELRRRLGVAHGGDAAEHRGHRARRPARAAARCVFHWPLIDYQNGDEFMAVVLEGVARRARSRSCSSSRARSPTRRSRPRATGPPSATIPTTGQPIPTSDWLDKLAPHATAIVAAGTCATYGGIHAMEGNPTGAMGVPDYLGWNWKSKAGPADRVRARLSDPARQLVGDAALPAEPGRRPRADDPARREPAPALALRS